MLNVGYQGPAIVNINSNETCKLLRKNFNQIVKMLLTKSTAKLLNEIWDKKILIEENLLHVLPNEVCDLILKFLDEIPKLEVYFDDKAWINLVSMIENKKIECTCKKCKKLIMEVNSVICICCEYWFHPDCAFKNKRVNKKDKFQCEDCL